MKKYILPIAVAVIAFSGCQLFNGGAPKGYTHIKIEKDKAEFNIPKDFSTRKDTVVRYPASPSMPNGVDVKFFKFTNVKDTNQNIVFTYSSSNPSKITVDQVMTNVGMGVAQNPTYKLKGNDTLQVNGQKCVVFGYAIMKDNAEQDYTKVLMTVQGDQVVSLNLSFKGKSQPEFATEAETVTKSLKLKK